MTRRRGSRLGCWTQHGRHVGVLDGVRFLCGFLFDDDNEAHERLVIGFFSFSGCYFIGLLSIGLLSDLFDWGCKLCLQFECGRICCGVYTHRSIHVYERLQRCVGQDQQAFLIQEMPQLPACQTSNLRQVIAGHGVETHYKLSRTFPKLLALLSGYPSKWHDVLEEREGTPGRLSDPLLNVDILAFPESF